MQRAHHYTTREVAECLGCYGPRALQLLKAANIPFERAGSAYLWEASAVDELLSTIRGGKVPRIGGDCNG